MDTLFRVQTERTRRSFFGVAGAVGVFIAAACSSDKSASGTPGGGAVTIKHAFGETVVPSPPARVVSAGFTDQDDLLAVGVVPIAVTKWFGDEPFGVWPWAQPKLGNAQPVVLSLENGIQVDRIAALKPDLIVATNAGLDQDTYTKLSAIAPTIPQSGYAPFFEPWKDQATAIGVAVFQTDAMAALIKGVDDTWATIAKDNPQFKGKSVALLQGTTVWQDSLIASLPSWKTDFLTQMGFVIPDSLAQYGRGDDRAFIPPAQAVQALSGIDVLVWKTDGDADVAALRANPNVAALLAQKERVSIFTTHELSGAIAFASPLSYPAVADQLTPMLVKVLG